MIFWLKIPIIWLIVAVIGTTIPIDTAEAKHNRRSSPGSSNSSSIDDDNEIGNKNDPLEVTFPDGGEHFEAGRTYAINWKNRGIRFDDIEISYQKFKQPGRIVISPRLFYRITSTGTTIQNTWVWRVPEILGEEYGSYKIHVRAFDDGKLIDQDESEDYFTIGPLGSTITFIPTHDLRADQLRMDILSPEGGEHFEIGQTISIKWESKHIGEVDIYLTTEDDERGDPIVKDFNLGPNDLEGEYEWTIPTSSTFREVFYKIKIVGERKGVGTKTDMSKDFFTITKDGTMKIGTTLQDVPREVKNTDDIDILWDTHNIDMVTLSYVSYPIEGESPKLIVDRTNTKQATWTVPRGLMPGYYALKLDGFIKSNQVSTDYSPFYIWVGEKNTDYRGERKVTRPHILPVDTSVERFSEDTVKIFWEETEKLPNNDLVLEYGVTTNYGNTITFARRNLGHGSVTLEDLIPGKRYHYRIRQRDKSTEDNTFVVLGGITFLGYNVLGQDTLGMSVRLSWEGQEPPYTIYFCTKVCDTRSAWTSLGRATDTTFSVANSLRPGETGFYKVTPGVENALQEGLGAEVRVINTFKPTAEEVNPSRIINSDRAFNKVKGKILLKVEARGEAYYVNPNKRTIHFLGSPVQAFGVLRDAGVGITNENISKIPVAVGALTGTDTDGDGLSDTLEGALGTDMNDKDTDGDGYTDTLEVEKGYSPTNPIPERVVVDRGFAKKHAGTIFLQVEKRGEAWYVDPTSNRRYFLGKPADAFRVMSQLGTGISNDSFDSLK